MQKVQKTRKIAPRLSNGYCRVRFGSQMPEDVKEGLRDIAIQEGKSMSWVVESVVIDYFKLERPSYIEPKTGKIIQGRFRHRRAS